MRPVVYLAVEATVAGAVACGEPMAPPGMSNTSGETEVRFDPPSSTTMAARVTRLIIEPTPEEPGSIGLFEGALSAYHLGRVSASDLPGTLLERQIAIRTWRESTSLVAAPERVLGSGERYSLAHAGGLLVEFVVTDATGGDPVLERLWPPVGSAGEPRGIYCGEVGQGAVPEEVVLEPGTIRARVTRGVAPGVREDDCLTLEVVASTAAGTVLQPPVSVGGVAFDPSPWIVATADAPEVVTCNEGDERIGPGCARIGDDRLMIVPAGIPQLWALRGERVVYAGVVEDEPSVVKGFEPGAENAVDVTVYDLAARRWSGMLSLTTAPATTHVVINEVLANPIGAEPAQEWIELQNDGDDTVELEGWTIEDTGARVVLPSCSLEPGRFVLVVDARYDASSAFDVPAVSGAEVLRVESLGAAGLRNSGEPLVLRDREGTLRSSFPGIGSTVEGFSVARKEPWAPDVVESFVAHAEPGASPGGPNKVF